MNTVKSAVRFGILSAALICAGTAQAARWGVGGSWGYWKMDVSDYQTDLANRETRAIDLTANGIPTAASGSVERGSTNWNLEAFYEQPVLPDFRLGFSAGYSLLPRARQLLDTMESNGMFTSTGYFDTQSRSIPFSTYVKWQKPETRYSLFGGAGADYLTVRTEYKEVTNSGRVTSGTLRGHKWAPHLLGGGEYFVTPHVAIGLTLKYIFAATVNNIHGNLFDTASQTSTDTRFIMDTTTYGELAFYSPTDTALTPGQRPLELDLGGLRTQVGVRYYFGN